MFASLWEGAVLTQGAAVTYPVRDKHLPSWALPSGLTAWQSLGPGGDTFSHGSSWEDLEKE